MPDSYFLACTGGGATTGIGVLVRDGDLVLGYSHRGGKLQGYGIQLMWTDCHFGGSRVWFRCPRCKRRAAKLYLQEGHFACRSCHRLAYVAQDYPTKAITMAMPFSAGGPGDSLARILGQAMTTTLKQQVIIENTAGAGGTIGSGKVAKSNPDGYTLLFTHISHATNPALYRKISYDTMKDFEPIGLVAELPMTLVANAKFPPKDFKELLAHLKANKDKVTYAHAGLGSASHLCGLLLQTAIQTPVTTVPYKGTAPAMTDLLGGQVDFMCDQTANTLQNIKAGKLKVYGVTSAKRVPQLPDVPTLQEAGLPNFELNIWYGLYAPKGTPKPVIDKLVAALQEVVKDPNVKARFADLGAIPVSPDRAQPEVLRAHVKTELDKWGPIIKQAGAYAD